MLRRPVQQAELGFGFGEHGQRLAPLVILEPGLRFEQDADVYDLPVTVTLTDAAGDSLDVVVAVTAPVTELRVPLRLPLRRVEVNREPGPGPHPQARTRGSASARDTAGAPPRRLHDVKIPIRPGGIRDTCDMQILDPRKMS